MTLLQIGFLLFGLLCFVISFFLSEKLSSSDINEFEKMSKADINAIVEKQLREADDSIKVMIDNGMEDVMDDFEVRADKLLNSKIMSISDYSDSVLTSIEKSHKEVIFMYNNLLDKQGDITELTKEMQALQSNLRNIKADIEDEIKDAKETKDFVALSDSLEKIESIDDLESVIEETTDEPLEVVLDNEIKSKKEPESIKEQNDRIIQMHNEGFDEVEIAKRLGRGLGEVKLVLGLFNRDKI